MLRALLASAIALPTIMPLYGGDLRIRFQYAGDFPVPQRIEVNKDVWFCRQHAITDQRLLVSPENRGIENVVVYVYTGRGGSDLAKTQQRNEIQVLAMQKCQFQPRIVTAQVGDTLKVTNPDPVGHNANISFLKNLPRGATVPSGTPSVHKLQVAEPVPIPVWCNIHPWMKAYVVILDHSYVAVSDEDGSLLIENLPEGEELTFRVFHEAATGPLDQVIVNGNLQAWPGNRFSMNIGPGINDYGTVTLTGDQLK